LLQAQNSKAKIIGLANAGGDTINSIKAANEFGLTKTQNLAGTHLEGELIHRGERSEAASHVLDPQWQRFAHAGSLMTRFRTACGIPAASAWAVRTPVAAARRASRICNGRSAVDGGSPAFRHARCVVNLRVRAEARVLESAATFVSTGAVPRGQQAGK